MQFKSKKTAVAHMEVLTRSTVCAFVTKGGIVHLQANVTNRKVSGSKSMGPWRTR